MNPSTSRSSVALSFSFFFEIFLKISGQIFFIQCVQNGPGTKWGALSNIRTFELWHNHSKGPLNSTVKQKGPNQGKTARYRTDC